jgi:putative nucleotidyltransferase with HDIG domain
MEKGGGEMGYEYSVSNIDFSKYSSKKSLLDLLEEHDKDSFIFCLNTGQLNMAIAKELGKKPEELYLLFQCGVFHDIGKLGMSHDFINYPGSYTIQMYTEMKKHTSGGGIILETINAEKELIETAKFHHCNFDGSGYPGGFYYNEIPLHARITRISDSVDAYMSKRCYKDGGPTNAVLDDLKQYKGTSYDPDLIEAFSRVHKNVMDISHRDGNDHPSQKLYMHFLDKLYGEKEKERFLLEIYNAT